MKTFRIALAATVTLAGAALISTQASAGPLGGPGGFKPGPMGGGFKPGGFKPGVVKPVVIKPGVIKPGPFKPIGPIGGLKPIGPKPGGGGVWKPPHKGHGHWHGGGWGYAAAGAVVGAAALGYYARPVYTSDYYGCEWVRVPTEYGWRWRPYC